MSNYVLLNNVTHKNLKIIRKHTPEYGDHVMYAITFPQEFRNLLESYPILFTKDADTGKFYPVALFSFRKDENLFLVDNGWDANYIPISIQRKPFLIGVQKTQTEGQIKDNFVVFVDAHSRRLSETEGEPVFLPHGGYSKYLEDVVSMLDYIHAETEANEIFINNLLKYDLLEALSLDIELRDGSTNKLSGFYLINEDKLKMLDGAALVDLHSQGYLECIYMIIASMSNINNLIQRIERKIMNTPA